MTASHVARVAVPLVALIAGAWFGFDADENEFQCEFTCLMFAPLCRYAFERQLTDPLALRMTRRNPSLPLRYRCKTHPDSLRHLKNRSRALRRVIFLRSVALNRSRHRMARAQTQSFPPAADYIQIPMFR